MWESGLAQQPLPPGAYYEDLCFLTQQAAELAVKAVYQVHGWLFPFVHNLGTLLDGLENQGLSLPAEVQDADQLNIYAVQARYPGLPNPATREEFEETLRIAEAVSSWAELLSLNPRELRSRIRPARSDRGRGLHRDDASRIMTGDVERAADRDGDDGVGGQHGDGRARNAAASTRRIRCSRRQVLHSSRLKPT